MCCYTIVLCGSHADRAQAADLLRNIRLGQAPAPAQSDLPDLTAVQVVSLLCSRAITATEYVQALDERYMSGDFACNNPWISYNISKVRCLYSDRLSDFGECCESAYLT